MYVASKAPPKYKAYFVNAVGKIRKSEAICCRSYFSVVLGYFLGKRRWI